MKNFKTVQYNPQLGLLILRVVLGAIFIAHGLQKVQMIDGVIGFFAFLGMAPFWAYIVAYTEFVAGIVLVLGAFTRIAGYLVSIIMIVAIFSFKKSIGFIAPGGYELDLILLAAGLCVSFAGPGMFALSKRVCGCGNCEICGLSK